ncbi:MAG: hypothetical protein ACJ77A_09200 [Actinomycetota bacterium]
MTELSRRRVAVASPDPTLAARVTHALTAAGHDVVLVGDSPFDAMEAAFSRTVEVLVLDQELARLSGSAVAEMIASAESAVKVVLLERRHPEEPGLGEGPPVLDPEEPGFEAALGLAVGGAAAESPRGQ